MEEVEDIDEFLEEKNIQTKEIGMEVLMKRVMALCNETHHTIYKAEQRLGWANGTIKRMKTSIPSAEKLMQLAVFFDVTTDYLLGFSDHRHSPQEELLSSWNLLTSNQIAFIQGVIRGFTCHNDDMELDNMDKTTFIETKTKYLRHNIEIMQCELKILESDNKRDMAIAIRGFKKEKSLRSVIEERFRKEILPLVEKA